MRHYLLSALTTIVLLGGLAAQPASAQQVFVRIAADLDEPRGLCLDIPGHRERVNTEAALNVHSCKHDIWNDDERFDPAALQQGRLRLPAYDRCAAARSATAGSAIILGDCATAPLGRWRFAEDGRLRLADAPELCLTVGPEPSELTPGGQRLPSRHVARSLALDACSADAADRQVWRTIETPSG